VTIIDTQSHWYPRILWETYLDNDSYPRCEQRDGRYAFEMTPGSWFPIPDLFVELELQIEAMHAAGIDAMVSSSASFGDVDGLPVPRAREVAHALNEERARAEKEYPGQFYGLATIPWQDSDAGIEVLDEAVTRLALRGVLLHSNVDGGPIDAEERRPIYRRIAELGVPVFLHPGRTVMEPQVRDYGLEYLLGYMFDTSLAALRLVLSGIIAELPDLMVVHPHAGATLPYLAGRIDSSYAKPYSIGHEFERAPSEQLASFYTDTMCQSEPTLRRGIDFYGLDHMLFGTDYPYFPHADAVAFVKGVLTDDELTTVAWSNAARLLRLQD
jgi:predicted TIM-barrel fold metal-dependent hydrolase